MATLMSYDDEGGGGGISEDCGGGDDTSSVTICGSSSSTINSHCFNTHHTPSPTILPSNLSSSPREQYNDNATTTSTKATSDCNGSTTNTHIYNNMKQQKTIDGGVKSTQENVGLDAEDEERPHGCGISKDHNNLDNITTDCAKNSVLALQLYRHHQQPEMLAKNLLLCRRFKDSGDSLRNFTSLPLFIYATSPSTHATSADGVGVAQVAVKAAEEAVANMKKVRTFFVYLKKPK